MAGCNDNCNCLFAGDHGIDVDGLGTAEDPYVITTEVGRHIPSAITELERQTLVVTDDDIGLIVYETDTGIAYIYDGATYGWRPLSVTAVEATIAASVTLTAAVNVSQVLGTITLAKGTWSIHAKFYVEASVDIGIAWSATLYDDTAADTLDGMVGSNSGSEQSSGVAETHWRAMPLQDLASFTVPSDVQLRVSRSSVNGSQLARHAKLHALSVAGARV